jgi:hypothetical protein
MLYVVHALQFRLNAETRPQQVTAFCALSGAYIRNKPACRQWSRKIFVVSPLPHPSLRPLPLSLIGGPGVNPGKFFTARLLYVSFGAFYDEINVYLMRRFVGRKYAFAVT